MDTILKKAGSSVAFGSLLTALTVPSTALAEKKTTVTIENGIEVIRGNGGKR